MPPRLAWVPITDMAQHSHGNPELCCVTVHAQRIAGAAHCRLASRLNYSSPLGGFENHAEINSSKVTIADNGVHEIQDNSPSQQSHAYRSREEQCIGPIKPQAYQQHDGTSVATETHYLNSALYHLDGKAPLCTWQCCTTMVQDPTERGAQQGCESGSITQTPVPELIEVRAAPNQLRSLFHQPWV